MKEIKYIIQDELGVHARPAGMLVKKLAGYLSDILVSSPTKEVDGKRILGVMGLGLKQGEEMKITFNGPDEEAAFEDVTAFLKENL